MCCSGNRADAVAYGSYRVDVHHPRGGGFLFKYLDGTTLDGGSGGSVRGRRRDPLPRDPTWYGIPCRVMVALNQLGEAAGTAAVLAMQRGVPVADVPAAELRRVLQEGGSVFPSTD